LVIVGAYSGNNGVAVSAVSQCQIEVAGLSINLDQGGVGPAVMVLHRSTGRTGWGDFETSLAENHHVTVPDLPGFGYSERPDWAREPRDLALLIGGLAAAAGLANVTLVGLGIGGFIAAELACMRPSWLDGLVLVGAQGVKPAEGEIRDQMLMGHEDYMRACITDDSAFTAVYGDEIDKATREMWDFNRIMTARICWSPYMFNRRLPPLLPLVRAKALIVWGEADSVTPIICADQYAQGIPDSRVERIAGAGHSVEIDRAAALADLVHGFAS
jgi:pimeloyl-ACP methyl ester carboxylesterase